MTPTLPRAHYQDHQLLRYPDAIVWFGALKVAGETGDNELAGQLVRRFDKYRANPKLVPDKFHVDYAVLGIVPLELYRLTKDPALKKLGMHRADGQWLKPTADGVTAQARYWVDDIYMIAAIQTAAYRVTHDPVYLDRAALTTATYLKRLQKDDGLFWHAEDSPFVWGRGVGWYAAGMTEILKFLPASHPEHPAIMGGYQKMMAALLQHQAPSGLWRQLVDKPETWQETSGSGMFAYAMVTGVRRGWLDPETYGPAARKAWLALVDQIDAGGNLQQVCVGTNKGAKEVGTDLEKQYQFYLSRPRVAGDYHGQAPLLWTAAALLEKEAE
jgi:unsaturated rhamnogalacturonyl hydrolase